MGKEITVSFLLSIPVHTVLRLEQFKFHFYSSSFSVLFSVLI